MGCFVIEGTLYSLSMRLLLALWLVLVALWVLFAGISTIGWWIMLCRQFKRSAFTCYSVAYLQGLAMVTIFTGLYAFWRAQ